MLKKFFGQLSRFSRKQSFGLGLLVIGILVAGGLLWYGSQSKLSATTVIGMIPSDVDQVFYLQFDEPLKKFIKSQQLTDFPLEYQKLIDQVESIALMQKQSTTPIILILAKLNPETNPQTLYSLGIPDVMSYRLIDKDTYLFANETGIQYFEQFKHNSLLTDAQLSPYVDNLISISPNVIFYSQTNAELALQDNNPLTQSIVSGLPYTIAGAKLSLENSVGRAIFVSENPTFSHQFSNKFTSFISTGDLAFMEIGNILSFFGISPEIVRMGIQTTIGNDPAFLATRRSEDIQALIQMLQNNLALTIGPANNLLGIGINLLFEGEGAYKALVKALPLAQSLLEPEIATYSGFITPISQGNSQGVRVVIPSEMFPFELALILKNINNNLYALSIGDGLLTQGSTKKLPRTPSTLFNFHINANQLLAKIGQFSMLIGKDIASDYKIFKNSVIEGAFGAQEFGSQRYGYILDLSLIKQ